MSNFDGSTHLSGTTLDANELTAIHNALTTKTNSNSAGLVGPVTTTAWEDINSSTLTVAADDYFIWTCNFVYSIFTDTGTVGAVRFLANGVAIGDSYPLRYFGPLANNGLVSPLSFTVHVFDLPAGSVPFKVQIQRTSGTGSVWVGYSYAWYARSKRGS